MSAISVLAMRLAMAVLVLAMRASRVLPLSAERTAQARMMRWLAVLAAKTLAAMGHDVGTAVPYRRRFRPGAGGRKIRAHPP